MGWSSQRARFFPPKGAGSLSSQLLSSSVASSGRRTGALSPREPEATRAEQTLQSAPQASNAAAGMNQLSECRSSLTFEQNPLQTCRPAIRPFERAGSLAAFHTQGGRPPRSPPAYPYLLGRKNTTRASNSGGSRTKSYNSTPSRRCPDACGR